MSFIINSYRFGEPTWLPTDLGVDLISWWDANDLSTITKDGSNLVSAWNDKSGNGWHLTQITGTAQPTYETGVLNSKPGIKFQTDDFLVNSTIAVNQTCAFVFVIKNPNTTKSTNEYVWDSDNASDRIALLAESSVGADDYVIYAGSIRDTGYGFETTGEINIATYIVGNTVSRFRYNGSQSNYAGSGVKNMTGMHMGCRYNEADFLNAHICEFFIVDRELTAGEIADIDDYLKPKWGISY